MYSGKRIISLLAGMLLAVTLTAQQAEVSVSRDRILLGEQFELTWKFSVNPGSGRVELPAFPDSINHMEVISRGIVDSVRTGDKFVYNQTIVMTGFEPGQWAIPSLVFRLNGKPYRSDSVKVSIMSVPLRGNDYNDIKEIIDVEEQGPDWKRILLFALGVVLILVLVYYWWKNRGARPPVAAPVSRSAAYDEAIQALTALKKEGLDQKGEMKRYYTGLYDIFRLYYSRVTGKPALQLTTEELILGTRDELEPAGFSSLAEVFRIANAVKFARYPSGQQESSESWERIRQGIEELNRKKR